MYTEKFLNLVLLTAAVTFVAQASDIEGNNVGHALLNQRQNGGKAPLPSDAPSLLPSSVPPRSSTTSHSSEPSSSSTSQPPKSSSTPVSPSSPASTPTPPPTSSQPPASTPEESKPTPTSQPPTQGSTSNTPTKGGAPQTTDGPKPSNTTPQTTPTPGLNTDSPDGPSGISEKTRNTIIGVVVGIGGAVVLGALGLVAWRVWGRKKQSDENEGLMEYDMGAGASGLEKPEPTRAASGNTRTPFHSTLETYHQPQQVNASSNF